MVRLPADVFTTTRPTLDETTTPDNGVAFWIGAAPTAPAAIAQSIKQADKVRTRSSIENRRRENDGLFIKHE
jgi:hypothetical protein